MKVVNFGSLNIDYTYRVEHFLRPGETMATKGLTVNCGGKGLNQSVALARAGVETYHAGFVGGEGAFLVEKLRESGAHVEFVRAVEQSCGHAIIQVTDSGENCILIYPGTNRILTEEYVDEVLSHFGPGDWVLLQNETNLVGEIMEKAAEKGMKVAFNAAPMDDLVPQYPLEKVDWLFVNETEGAAISGKQDYDGMVAALRQRYPNTNVVLTLGEEGCRYAGTAGACRVGACAVQAVDTTAAGDTFTGYFLRCLLDGRPVEEALQTASVASAIAVTRPGAADSIPLWEEVASSQLKPQA